jgi:hypothetical protein
MADVKAASVALRELRGVGLHLSVWSRHREIDEL